jgi:hypothetical protein
VCPEHVGIPATGDDAGTFRDALITYARDQPDTRHDFFAGLGLGDVASGQRGKQERRKEQSSYLVSGHVVVRLRLDKQSAHHRNLPAHPLARRALWQVGFYDARDCPQWMIGVIFGKGQLRVRNAV